MDDAGVSVPVMLSSVAHAVIGEVFAELLEDVADMPHLRLLTEEILDALRFW